MRVLVIRSGALGDVILTTPVIERLAAGGCEVHVQTGCPAVFVDNPHVRSVNAGVAYDRVVNLDMAYERRPRMHVVDAYMEEAFGDAKWHHKQQRINVPPGPIHRKNRIVVHAGISWKNRTMPLEWWDYVCDSLNGYGVELCVVGTPNDLKPRACQDFRGYEPIASLAQMFGVAGCFIGIDSAPLHIAGSTNVPIVGIFTVARAEYRLPYRKGSDGKEVVGANCTALSPDLDCYGCLADYAPPVTFADCRRGDFACISVIRPVDAVKAVLTHLEMINVGDKLVR